MSFTRDVDTASTHGSCRTEDSLHVFMVPTGCPVWCFPGPFICTDAHATHTRNQYTTHGDAHTRATSAGGQSSRDTQVGLAVLHEAVVHFHDPKGKSVTPQPFGDVLYTLAGDEWIARLHHVVESHRREVRDEVDET